MNLHRPYDKKARITPKNEQTSNKNCKKTTFSFKSFGGYVNIT